MIAGGLTLICLAQRLRCEKLISARLTRNLRNTRTFPGAGRHTYVKICEKKLSHWVLSSRRPVIDLCARVPEQQVRAVFARPGIDRKTTEDSSLP